ncbi:MAG TPA: response regulator [Thermoanaerobaculia bacterium]|jgi:signal transduction histidine kinase/DNA-binding response OmpR family regulator
MTTPAPISILLLEDTDADVELMERQLTRAGVQRVVRRVTDEPSFRGALLDGRYDVILADYHLPLFNGMTALRIAREACPDVPFIFVSGSIGEERAIDALREGATDYILKDRPSRLPAAIARALEERQDLSRRIEAERALRDLNRTHAMILQHASEGILALDRTGALIFANRAAHALLGWNEAPSGDAHAELHDCDRATCPIEAVMQTGRPTYLDEPFRRGKATFCAGANCSPMLDDERITGCVVLFEDLDSRKRLQRQLEQAERISSLGRIAAMMAHEFNNVLMAIQPFAQLVRKRSANEPVIANAATQILNSVARGRTITQDILRTTSLGQSTMSVSEVGEWLRMAEPELTAVAGERVSLQVRSAADPIRATFDPVQMRQVLANLVVNARDAMLPEGGTITISAAVEAGDRARITVADTGSGIPADVLPHIFDALFTTKRSGTGLGLAVVRQLVERNRGTVEVETQIGAGTAFHIVLPGAAAPAITNASVQRLVLVEDDENVAEGVSQLLALEGVAVDHVAVGGLAEEAVARFVPDAVLLDLNLPDVDGTQVFERLNARWPQLPVVFCSGDIDTTRVLRYLDSPKVRFLRKPYDIELLMQALHEIA